MLLLCGSSNHALLARQCFARFKSSSSTSRWQKRQNDDEFTKKAKSLNLRSRAAFKLMEIDDDYHLFKKNKTQMILDLGFAPGAWSQVARQRTSSESAILGVDILPCEPPRGVSSLQANILSTKTLELIRIYFSKRFELNKHYPHINHSHGYFNHTIEEIDSEEKEKNEESYVDLFANFPNSNNKVAQFPLDIIMSDMYVPLSIPYHLQNSFTNRALNRLANTSGIAIRDHLQSIDLCDAALITAIELLKPGGSFICKLYTGKEEKSFEKRLNNTFQQVVRIKPISSRNESKEIYFVGKNKRQNLDKLDVFVNS